MTRLHRKNRLQLGLLLGIEAQTQLAQAAFDQSADAILAINPESGNILAANEASVELFGVNSQDKLLKLTTLDLSREHQPDGLPSQQRLKTLTSEALQNGTIDVNGFTNVLTTTRHGLEQLIRAELPFRTNNFS